MADLMQWIDDWGTLAIAAWGAVTGTFAVFHNWRLSRRDRGKLNVVVTIVLDDLVPPNVDLHVYITNVGRRTLHLDYVVLERSSWILLGWAVPPWRLAYKRTTRVSLNEGQRELRILSSSEERRSLCGICRLRVVDTLGNSWLATRWLRIERAIRRATVRPVEEKTWGRSQQPGYVHLGLYPPLQGRREYRLQGTFHSKRHGRLILSRYSEKGAAMEAFASTADLASEFHRKKGEHRLPDQFPHSKGGISRPLSFRKETNASE